MKLFFNVLLIIIVICSCQSNSHKSSEEEIPRSGTLIQDTIKYMINKSCKDAFPAIHIYAVRITKLKRSTIMNIEPVYYNNYLDEYKYPTDFYEHEGSLFLVYCGVEAVKKLGESYTRDVKNKFNSVCLQYGIGKMKNIIHDDPPLFFKVQGDSLLHYSKGNEREFYMTFFEIEEVKPFYTPKTSSSTSASNGIKKR